MPKPTFPRRIPLLPMPGSAGISSVKLSVIPLDCAVKFNSFGISPTP
jgi:hypothetical protein